MPYSHIDINCTPYDDRFEQLYIQLRKKEQRFYSDEEVSKLPLLVEGHRHYREWQLRKKSSDRLLHHLTRKRKPLAILEIGCGNGWLAARLANNIPGHVLAMDINREELEQAARVFSRCSNLQFLNADIRSEPAGLGKFDIIIFAASLQYFPSLKDVIQTACRFLEPCGEIHIIDTIFYRQDKLEAARKRTKEYYDSIGFPEAAAYYFHHSWEALNSFAARVLYNPESWLNKLGKDRSPFPWICIVND